MIRRNIIFSTHQQQNSTATTIRNFTTSTRSLFSWKTPNNGTSSSSGKVKSSPFGGASSTTPTAKNNTSSNTANSTKRSNPFQKSSSSSNKKTNNNNNAKSSSTEESTETTTKSWTEKFNEWRKQTSVKKLVLIHGPVFGTWYFILNTAIQLAMASTLHYNLAGHIIESRELAVKCGMEEKFDAYANKTYYLLQSPIAVNGRFIANYVVVATMMAPVIPVKISWTLASYPFVLKLIPLRYRPVWKGNVKA